MKDDLEEAKRLLLIGDRASAKETLKKFLKHNPRNPDALHGIAFLYFQDKKYKRAEEILKQAIQYNQEDPELHFSLGTLYLNSESWENASLAFEDSIKIFESISQEEPDPRYLNILMKLAEIYIRQLQFPKAKEAIKKILKADPRNPSALKLLAQVYVAHLQYYLAIETLEKLKLEESVFAALKVEIFLLKQDFRNALHCAKRAVEIQPQNPHYLELLGNSYIKCQQFEKSINVFRKGLKFEPDNVKMLSRLLSLLIRVCEWKEREDVVLRLKSIMKESGEPIIFILPTIAILAGFSNEEIQNIASLRCNIIEENARPVRERLKFAYPNLKETRIKIGYLSSDFHDHATAHLMLDLFALHDRKKFEIYAYSYGKEDRSELREKIKKDCDHFIDIAKTSDLKAAEKIHADNINILVDLKGHIVDQRLDILALKPAPLQLHYLGYPGTIGASFIDYLIADSYLIPKEERNYYTESIIYMPYTYQVNTAEKIILKAIPERKEYRLPEDKFVFCCFNQNDKFDTETVTLWMRLLAHAPNSVLWIWGNYEQIGKKLKAFGESFGVAEDRFIVSPTEPNPRHLARIQLADLFLDTLYYNAHTSCSDALRVGLPVLTCPGKTFASRVAASLLKRVKASELIAKDPEDYLEKALALVNAPEKLKGIKQKILRHLKTSHIYDPALFAAHLDQAFIQIWERYQSGKKPRDIWIKK